MLRNSSVVDPGLTAAVYGLTLYLFFDDEHLPVLLSRSSRLSGFGSLFRLLKPEDAFEWLHLRCVYFGQFNGTL